MTSCTLYSNHKLYLNSIEKIQEIVGSLTGVQLLKVSSNRIQMISLEVNNQDADGMAINWTAS